MGMTLSQMVSEVQSAVGDTSSGFRDTIIAVLNRKRKLLFRKHQPSAAEAVQTVSLVSGTEEYDLPSTVGHIYAAKGGDGREISVRDEREFLLEHGENESDTGDPNIIRQYGRSSSGGLKVKFWPIPQSAETATLLVYTQPATLSDDDDTSEFDDDFDQASLEETIAYCQLINQDPMAQVSEKMAKRTSDDYAAFEKPVTGAAKATIIRTDEFVNFRRDYD